jgi:hypothetical protein
MMTFTSYLNFDVPLAKLSSIQYNRSADVDSVVFFRHILDHESVIVDDVSVIAGRMDLLTVPQPINNRRWVRLNFTLHLVPGPHDRELFFRRINPRDGIWNMAFPNRYCRACLYSIYKLRR